MKADPRLTRGELVRMAMEDYMPRHKQTNGGGGVNSNVRRAMQLDPGFKAEMDRKANRVLMAHISTKARGRARRAA